MHVNPQNIISNSNATFSILNQAQKNESDLVEKVAKLNIKEKIQADKNAILGQVIDLTV